MVGGSYPASNMSPHFSISISSSISWSVAWAQGSSVAASASLAKVECHASNNSILGTQYLLVAPYVSTGAHLAKVSDSSSCESPACSASREGDRPEAAVTKSCQGRVVIVHVWLTLVACKSTNCRSWRPEGLWRKEQREIEMSAMEVLRGVSLVKRVMYLEKRGGSCLQR